MSPPAGPRRDERRVDLGKRFLEAVTRLVADGETFTTLSIERIAVEAGVARSTFYLYFQDKTELLQVWFVPVAQEIQAATEGWLDLDGASDKAEVRDVLQRVAGVYRTHAASLAIVYDAIAYDPIVRDLVSKELDRSTATIERHIKAGQRAGWVDQDLTAHETATWFSWMAQRGGHEMMRIADEARLDELLDGHTDVVWGSLRGADVAADTA